MNQGFSQLGTQLKTIWQELSIGQRFNLVFAGLVIIGGMVALGVWSSRPDYALLYGKLDDAEASRVLAALDDAKVPYRVNRGGGAILIPADKVYIMRMQLAAKGIPRGDGVGYEIFDKPNFGISDFVQRANYIRAVQGELARTISQVDSVESSRVMIVMPENRLTSDSTRKPTASVFVHVRGNSQLATQTVAAIRFLVANAVEGLTPNNVSVVDNLGNVLSENSDGDPIAGLTSNQLSARRNLEQYLARKAETMLEKVLGPGQAVVRVSAEINYDNLQRTEDKYDPEGQVLRTSTVNDESTDSLTANSSSGGTVGTPTNANSETNSVAGAPATRTNTKKKVTNNQFEINKVSSTTTQGAGGMRRLTAAVFVAQRFTGTGTNRVAQPRTPQEITRLQKIVEDAVGIQQNLDPLRRDSITVEEAPFSDPVGADTFKELEHQERSRMWMDLASNAIYPALGLGALFLLWRMFQNTPTDPIPLGVPVGAIGPDGTMAGALGPGSGGPITVEAFNQMVRENPANMTQAIRGWMSRNPSAK
jgi:flagellar M-ring protein FliF